MAFPLTTEPALCSHFRILWQDLAPILRSKELLSFWDIHQELESFLNKISQVQDLLNNTEERIIEICGSHWIDNLIELLYDMENLVDEMNIQRVRMDQQLAIRNQDRTSHDAAHEYSYMDNIENYWHQMKAIKQGINDASARLDKALKGAKDLNLKPQAVGESPDEEDVGAAVGKSGVYGRQQDQDFLIQEYLLSSSHSSKKNYSTVSLVGMGGMGKTTLARLIFNDERVKKTFDVQSWACVSHAFDAKKVVKDLIEYATDKNVSNMAAATLGRHLKDSVEGKKILIVLDNVWEVKTWDSLEELFNHCAKGSKILVTTRDKSVGNSISNKECYELKPLEDEDCWHLFKEKAFGEDVNENLEKIGREIVKKCKGVPLAVKVIGSTLKGASTERWENALRNELWQVEPMARDEIFPALKLSYHYLPSPLKRCFGYLSLFPTDHELKQDRVVRLWIAEGFIEDRGGRSWEDIGHEYYKELQRRCLIQEDDKMHDLIHSLACSVAGKFSYRMPNGNDSSTHMERVRHLSVINGNMDLGALKDLRTLLLFDVHFSEKTFDQISEKSLLRVLYLESLIFQLELPNSVGRLKCLRYLGLSGSHGIECLPESICKLQNLQTLDLRCCFDLRSLPNDIGDLQKLGYLCLSHTSLSDLPTSIGNLVSLRKLYLKHAFISSLPDSICRLQKLRVLDLSYCKSFSNLPDEIGALQDLRELNLSSTSISHLPKSIGNLLHLRNLDIRKCEKLSQLPEDICNLSSLDGFEFDQNLIRRLPRGIGGLRSIKRLDKFVVGKEEGWGIEELNGMNKLKGSLTISHLENVDSVEKALMASLKKKIYINRLHFEWSSMDDASDDSDLGGVEALEDDASDDSNLGGVGLTTRDGEMEANVLEALEPYPTGLVNLSLVNYHGERVPMWMANLRFPSLEELTLDGLQYVERVMDMELPSLTYLRIKNCPKLIVVSMALPSLGSLHVSSCQELTTLCLIPSLQSIEIINCPGLVPFLDKVLPPMLRKLKIESCTTLQHLPRGLQHNTSLMWLLIEDCPELVSFPEEGLPPMLQNLLIANLRHVPRGLGHNTSLLYLTIKDCPELVFFPEEGFPPILQDLSIRNCTNLRHLPSGLRHNTSLTSLRIEACPKLVSFPEEGLPPMLQNLEIANLGHLPRGLGHNTSLTSLTIRGCPELVSFPEEGLPPMLQDLSITDCANLRHLPTCLCDLTSLKTLKLYRCPELGVRLDDQLPPDLRLEIYFCRKLERQLKDEDRKDWLTKSSFALDWLPKSSQELKFMINLFLLKKC